MLTLNKFRPRLAKPPYCKYSLFALLLAVIATREAFVLMLSQNLLGDDLRIQVLNAMAVCVHSYLVQYVCGKGEQMLYKGQDLLTEPSIL